MPICSASRSNISSSRNSGANYPYICEFEGCLKRIFGLYQNFLMFYTCPYYNFKRTPIVFSVNYQMYDVFWVDQKCVAYRILSMPKDCGCIFDSLCYIIHGNIKLRLDIWENILPYEQEDWERFKVWVQWLFRRYLYFAGPLGYWNTWAFILCFKERFS